MPATDETYQAGALDWLTKGGVLPRGAPASQFPGGTVSTPAPPTAPAPKAPKKEEASIGSIFGLLPPPAAPAIGAGGGRKTRRNATSGGSIVSHLLTIRNQVKLYHWQTNRFARHKATDDLTAALDLSIDAFVESYMGRYGRPKVSGSLKLHNFSEAAATAFIARETKYLETELPKEIGKGDTDLLNLRDTILGDLTKVSYLFTLS